MSALIPSLVVPRRRISFSTDASASLPGPSARTTSPASSPAPSPSPSSSPASPCPVAERGATGDCADAPDLSLDALVERYAHRVGYFARRIERRFGLDSSGRDDLESAGYWGLLKALRNRREDAHERELSAYVSRRVEGAVIDEARCVLRRASNHTQCDPDELETELSSEWGNGEWLAGQEATDPEAWADLQGRWKTIEAAFGRLPQEHKNLLMAYASGRSLAEIARSAGSSPAHLQNQMNRISRAVRAQSPELRRLLRFEI